MEMMLAPFHLLLSCLCDSFTAWLPFVDCSVPRQLEQTAVLLSLHTIFISLAYNEDI